MARTSTTKITTTTRAPASGMTDESRGLLLGLMGVVIFAATGPLTKLAVG